MVFIFTVGLSFSETTFSSLHFCPWPGQGTLLSIILADHQDGNHLQAGCMYILQEWLLLPLLWCTLFFMFGLIFYSFWGEYFIHFAEGKHMVIYAINGIFQDPLHSTILSCVSWFVSFLCLRRQLFQFFTLIV